MGKDTVIVRTGGPVLVTMVEHRSYFTLNNLMPSKEDAVVTAAILEATKPQVISFFLLT